MKRSGLVLAVTVLGALMVPACAVIDEVRTSLFEVKRVNLTDRSYAAADMLAQQTKTRMTQQTPLRIAMLTDVTTPYEVTAFGQQVANHLGSRFVQLGYNVQSVPVPPALLPESSAAPVALNNGAPKPVQMGVAPSMGKGEALLSGTYTRMKDTVQVSLKILQSPDQKVIAAYDYILPMTRDIRETSMSEADRLKRDADPVGGIFAKSP